MEFVIDLQGIVIVQRDLWDQTAKKNVHPITMDPIVTIIVFACTMVLATLRMVPANVQRVGPDLHVNLRVHLNGME